MAVNSCGAGKEGCRRNWVAMRKIHVEMKVKLVIYADEKVRDADIIAGLNYSIKKNKMFGIWVSPEELFVDWNLKPSQE